MEELYEERLEIILRQIRAMKRQHPKANVAFDPGKDRISITYPLPKDYFKIKKFGLKDL